MMNFINLKKSLQRKEKQTTSRCLDEMECQVKHYCNVQLIH